MYLSGEMLEWCSNLTAGLNSPTNVTSSTPNCKVLHEELCLQWVVASGAVRDSAMQNSWSVLILTCINFSFNSNLNNSC